MIVLYNDKPIYINEKDTEQAYNVLESIIYAESQRYDWIFPNFKPTILKKEIDGSLYLIVPIEPSCYDPEVILEDDEDLISHEILLKVVEWYYL